MFDPRLRAGLRLAASTILLLAGFARAASPRTLDIAMPDGQVRHYDRAALDALPPSELVAGIHDDPPVRWHGVALADLLRENGAPAGEALRGDALSLFVLATAGDGYRVVFSLAELDPKLGGRRVLVATEADGAALDAAHGPLRLVSPDDGRPARWLRDLRRIELLRAPSAPAAPSP